MKDGIKPIVQSIIDHQISLGHTIQALAREAGIEVCSVSMDNKIHIFTLPSLKIIAKNYDKQITFSSFNDQTGEYSVKGYFYINNTEVFALG